MPRFSEDTLSNWTKPASDTEESKLSNSERMVKEAIASDAKLSRMNTDIFGQGSYANDTNVRLNSDIDINVEYCDGFYFTLPDGAKRDDFGLNSPASYSYAQYKNDVETALVNKFGRGNVVRKNKCITVLGNSFRVETDVVPTWNHRWYRNSGEYVEGVQLFSDDGQDVVNYPKQHIENGKGKNANTSRRFKRLTRIFRKLRYKMIDDGVYVDDSITSFLLECLVWNVPNRIFNEYDTWQERLRQSIIHLYDCVSNAEKSKDWGEVSECLYLFNSSKKWTRDDVNKFLVDAWNYLGHGD